MPYDVAGNLQNWNLGQNYLAGQQLEVKNALLRSEDARRNQELQQQQAAQQHAAAKEFITTAIANLSAVESDPAQFARVADAVAAHPITRQLGITRDQITPENVAAIRTRAGIAPPQPKYMPAGEHGVLQIDPTGKAAMVPGSVAPQTITPYQQAQLDMTRRGQDMTNQREKDRLAAQQNPLGIGMTAGGPATANVSGDEFLKTIDPKVALQVKALADGRMAFPTGFALRSPYWQNMLQAVSQYDPNFDAVNYNARAKTRADFTSGKNAQNIKALNTAIGHLGTLDEQIGGTASGSLTPLNYLGNRAAELTGSAGPTKFKQTRTALASELTQVFRGTGGAEADVKRYIDELSENASQEQKKAAVQNIASLLNSRLLAIGDQYNQGMGTTADPLNLLNPHAQDVIKRVTGSPAPSVDIRNTAAGGSGWKSTRVK